MSFTRTASLLPRMMFALNHLLEAVAEVDPGRFDGGENHLEGFSILGRVAEGLSRETLEELVGKFKTRLNDVSDLEDEDTKGYVHLLMYGGLGHLLCGLGDADLTELTEGREKSGVTLLAVAGRMKTCPSPVALEIFANQVRNFVGITIFEPCF